MNERKEQGTGYSDKPIRQCCQTCEWYAHFEGVCCNGDSEHAADFREYEDACGEWETITLPPEQHRVFLGENGKTITVCTIRQKALHVIGLDRLIPYRKPYWRHGRRFYKPYRNYFWGQDKDLDRLADAGYMDRYGGDGEKDDGCRGQVGYRFNRAGLDWLGEQIRL